MTKERLRALPYEDLFKIATHGNISIGEDQDKEALVAQIYEALEEDRQDREELTNLAVRIEAKKFAVSQDEELLSDFGEAHPLPDRYNESRVMLMLRDPSWVYCYWDISDNTVAKLHEQSDFEGLVLRVIEMVSPSFEKEGIVDWFDIPVQIEDRRRYINLPSENTFYCVEIIALLGEEEEHGLLRSNIIETSRNFVATSRTPDEEKTDLLIELSGFSTDFREFPGIQSHPSIPQRILDLTDQSEFEES